VSLPNRLHQLLPRVLLRPVAHPKWDRLLRGCGVVSLTALLLSSVLPVAGDMGVLFSLTLLVNGPYGALLPAAQEPIIMIFARIYPPTLVAVIATVSATMVEYVNYRLFDAAVHSRMLDGARRSRQMRQVVRWFELQPFVTVAFCALTPIPFVLARIVAVAARYPAPRFLWANAFGRLPRFWAYGAVGALIPVSNRDLLLASVIITAVLVGVIWLKRGHPIRSSQQH
jgi:membrane protein DedA with SNARE-associated domain